MEKEKDEILLETRDEGFFVSKIFELLGIVVVIVCMFLMRASLEEKGLISMQTVLMLAIAFVFSSAYFIIFSYKKRKILFYENKIVLYNGHKALKTIKNENIEDVYKILPYHVYSNADSVFNKTIKRWDTPRKLVFITLLPLLLLLLFLSYLASSIFYKSLYLKRYRLVIVGKTDKDFLVVNYTGSNQKKIEEYFNNLKINLNSIRPNYWPYVPNKGKE